MTIQVPKQSDNSLSYPNGPQPMLEQVSQSVSELSTKKAKEQKTTGKGR